MLMEVVSYCTFLESFLLLQPSLNIFSKTPREIKKNVDLSSANYDCIFLLDDFDAEIKNNFFREFWDLYGIKSLIKVPKCYKNPANLY